jgi:NADH-quinone oxidoreductase subunit G
MLHSVDDDWLMPVKSKKIVAPSEIAASIAAFKEILSAGKNAAVLIGNFAQQHPQAAQIHAAAQALGVKVGFLGEAANSVGGYVAGLPAGGGLPKAIASQSLFVFNAEPELDLADPSALGQAKFTVVMSPWKHSLGIADVLLPIAPFSETPGTFVSAEGRAQSFHAAVHPLGEARPGWKLLRVLGTMLGKPGFEFDTVEQVRAACLGGKDIAALLSNKINLDANASPGAVQGIQRIADVPIYFADALVRRSPPLQATRDAEAPKAWMNRKLFEQFGNAKVRISQGKGQAVLDAALDDKLPDGCVRVAAGHASTAGLGAMFGTLSMQKGAG